MLNSNPDSLANFFRDLRLSRGLSSEALARLCGLPLRQIECLEDGGAEKTSLAVIHGVLNQLNVSEDEFTRFTQIVEAARKAVAAGKVPRRAQ